MLVEGHPSRMAFSNLPDGEALPQAGAIIVSLSRFTKEREALLARAEPVGVRLETGESPEALGADVQRLELIVLHVPYLKDGRAFSWARLLRTRLGYQGELRVSGHVLRDQIAFYARVGVDSFELPQAVPAAEVEAARSEISHVYQPSVDGQVTIRELRARRAPRS